MEFITQLKSWLNLEPSIGCPNSCAYCYRHEDGDFELRTPKPTLPVEELVEQLEEHPFFIPHETHLSINGTKSDAFLPQNKERTFRLMDMLDSRGYRNWVTVVTKAGISPDDARRLKSFSNIKVVVYVTYSEMPSFIERVPNQQRIESMKSLNSDGVKTILYWRPIIAGFNTSREQLGRVLDVGGRYADAFVLSGLRVSPVIKK